MAKQGERQRCQVCFVAARTNLKPFLAQRFQARIVVVKTLSFISLLALVASCSLSGQRGSDWGRELAEAEQAFEQRLRETSVFRMPVDAVFADPMVRSLAIAAGRGSVDDIRRILANGVDIDATGYGNATPLFWAWRQRSQRGFDELLRQGANPNQKIDNGSADTSILHLTAGINNTRFLELALLHGGDPNLYVGAPSKTPIFETFSLPLSTTKRITRLLIDAGADINATTGYEFVAIDSYGGSSAAYVAAQSDRYDIVYDLLTLGADYTIKDEHDRDLFSIVTHDYRRFRENSSQGRAIRKVVKWLADRGVEVPLETDFRGA